MTGGGDALSRGSRCHAWATPDLEDSVTGPKLHPVDDESVGGSVLDRHRHTANGTDEPGRVREGAVHHAMVRAHDPCRVRLPHRSDQAAPPAASANAASRSS